MAQGTVEHSHSQGLGMAERVFKVPGSGLRCGNCNEFLSSVYRSIPSPGFMTRERVCSHCGKINTTSERVIETRDKRRQTFSGNE